MAITENRRLGNIGENVAAAYLLKHGYIILERNYLRKCGEIDIVAQKGGVIHFIEVKSTSRAYKDVSHVTAGKGTRETTSSYRPEENLHPQKLKRLHRAIQTYILEKHLDEKDWQLDLVVAYIDEDKRQARVELIDNIVT